MTTQPARTQCHLVAARDTRVCLIIICFTWPLDGDVRLRYIWCFTRLQGWLKWTCSVRNMCCVFCIYYKRWKRKSRSIISSIINYHKVSEVNVLQNGSFQCCSSFIVYYSIIFYWPVSSIKAELMWSILCSHGQVKSVTIPHIFKITTYTQLPVY